MKQAAPDAIAADVAHDGLRVALLGGFSVAIGPRVIAPSAWRLRKAGHLIKLLALAPQHQMHREQVLDTLWPHLDPNAAGNNLRVTLHFARKLLDPEPTGDSGALQVNGDLLVLFPNRPVEVDVDRFEALAQAALRSDDAAEYIAALDRYGGELLPEDRFEDWAIERRAGLQSIHLALLRNLARLHEQRGDPDRAIETLCQALADDPDGEPVHVALMRLYAGTGRRARALRQYQQLHEALQRDLDIEPEPETTRLYEAILTGSFSDSQQPAAATPPPTPSHRRPAALKAAQQEPRTNLPPQLTSFVGREQERARLRDALARVRLVTLTGPGGAGKTRLAIEVAGHQLEAYEDGVWLVDLTGLTDAALVPRTVAVALKIQEADGRQPIDVLSEALAGKKLLLVLDNCEHLITAAAELADQLLRAGPELRILATSREALRVPGEVVWPVPALAVPTPGSLPALDALERVEAVQLFLERARLNLPDLVITAANAAAIAAICYRLDGLPLAIELAAARVRSLPVHQIAARLDEALPLLTGGSRRGPARHRSLQETIRWSYDLLSAPEQRLLTRLAVFASSFTIEAAEAICADEPVPPGRVIEVLIQLVDKSLIVVEEHDGDVRYRLLETIQQFARDVLETGDESQMLRRRFRDWYRALAERAEPELLGPGNVYWMLRMWSEIDNIRAVLDSGRRDDSLEDVLRIATALWPFWVQSTQLTEGRGWLEQLVAHPDIDLIPEPLRARAIFGAAIIAQRQGDFIQATTWTEDALTRCQTLDDQMGIVFAYNNLCTCALMRNDYDRTVAVCTESLTRSQAINFGVGIVASLGSLGEAELTQGNLAGSRQWLQQSLALAREMNFAPFMTWMLANLGEAARHDGDTETARACLLESLAIARGIRDGLGVGRALRGLGLLALDAGNTDEAATQLVESLEAVWALGYKAEIARALEALAGVAIVQLDPTRATRLLAAAAALRDAIDCAMAPIDRDTAEPVKATAQRMLGEARFAWAWSDGRSLRLAQAVAEALRLDDA